MAVWDGGAAELPRETETLQPKENACPDCGGRLDRLGEDVSETLEYVPARFKVIRTVRPKLSCTGACQQSCVLVGNSSNLLETGLKHGIELRKSDSNSARDGSPSAIF